MQSFHKKERVGFHRRNQIVAEHCQKYGITVAEFESKERTAKIAFARFRVMRDLRELGWSYEKIGEYCNRDHTAVIYGCRRIEEFDRVKLGRDIIYLTEKPMVAKLERNTPRATRIMREAAE